MRGAARAELLLELASLPAQDLSDYLQAMAATITRALSLDRTDVLLLDDTGEALTSLAARNGAPGEEGQDGGALRVPLHGPSPLAAAFLAAQPSRIADVRDEPAMPPLLAQQGLRAVLAVPLFVAGKGRGLLCVASRHPNAFGREDQALLAIVAARVGLLIENAELAAHRAALEREQARHQAREELLSLVSHELKTPLAVIKAYAELLRHRAEHAGDAEGMRVLDRIGEQTARLLGLIEDLLDLQRLEIGLMALERSRFDLSELATRVAENMQQTTTNHTLNVGGAEPVVVHADRRRIEQVLVNLLENAIKYSPGGGAITVTVRRALRGVGPEEQAIVAVGDQGLGIAASDLPRVFDRFYQVGGGRLHRGVRGLGIGLYIAHEIVERHGGIMWVESVEGQGSTFYLSLPLDGGTE